MKRIMGKDRAAGKRWRQLYCLIGMVAAMLIAPIGLADTLRIAVASNFLAPAKLLSRGFEKKFGYKVLISSGSTGKLYSQIVNGAPYDVFLAADENTPAKLLKSGRASKVSPYAIGKLVLWSRSNNLLSGDMEKQLQYGEFNRLARANPKIAPYGRAAEQVLQRFTWYASRQKHILRSENITQAFQYAASGNADFALVAYSQVLTAKNAGSYFMIPESWYLPIVQSIALLSRADHSQAALDWYNYILSDETQQILMRKFGYNRVSGLR